MRAIVLSVLGVAVGCGRVDFAERSDSAVGGEVPVELDATICDEITGVLRCEGFEAPLENWTAQSDGNAFVGIATARVYRGAGALRSFTDGPSQRAWLIGHELGGRAAGDLYARFYLFRESHGGQEAFAGIHLVEDQGAFTGVTFGASSAGTVVTSSVVGVEGTSDVQVPADRWTCVQVHAAISDSVGVIESSVDGVPAARLTGLDTLPPTPYMNEHIGMFSTGVATEPIDVWTDEMIVATSPIACD